MIWFIARASERTPVPLLALIAFATLAGLSCVPDKTPRCAITTHPGLTVHVLDAESGEPIGNAVVTASDGEYSEVLVSAPSFAYIHEGVFRAGTFDVEIVASGFQTTSINDIWILGERYACQDYVPVDIVVHMATDTEGQIAAD